MNVYSIKCYKENDRSPVEITEVMEILKDDYHETIYVDCEPPTSDISNVFPFNNNSFKFTYYGDTDFVVNQNRCELDIYIKKNLTPYDRYFYITLTHVDDSEAFTTVTIKQKSDDYNFDISNETIINNVVTHIGYFNKEEDYTTIHSEDYETMSDEEKEKYGKLYELNLETLITSSNNASDFKKNYEFFEIKDINFEIDGGSKRFKIKSLNKQHKIDVDEYVRKNFDRGFIYTLFDDKITIKNYGRPFLEEDDIYEMTLCHKDFEEKSIRIQIKYNELPQNHTRLRSNQNRLDVSVEETNVNEIHYPSYSELKMMSLQNENNVEQMENVSHEIVFDDDISDGCLVYGKHTKEMHFTVLENGVESDLMVGCYSSARWCSVTMDSSNRKIKITIQNKPICERKSFVQLSIVDYPETSISFLVVNKN